MKISIITACYNSEAFINSAIQSVLSQSYRNIEYIVIDGGSQDATLSIVGSYGDQVSHFLSGPDKGIYDAMNKGLALATGDVIGILNSDDFYPNANVLSDVAQVFIDNPNVDMVLGNVDFVSPDDLTRSVRFYSSFNFKPWTMRFGFMPAHPGAFIKKTAYDNIGSYKLGYKSGADFDMFVRMLLVAKLPYVKLNRTLVNMRTGGVSTSGLKSYATTSKEVLRSLKENHIYSNRIMVLLRFPIKYIHRFFKKNKGVE